MKQEYLIKLFLLNNKHIKIVRVGNKMTDKIRLYINGEIQGDFSNIKSAKKMAKQLLGHNIFIRSA